MLKLQRPGLKTGNRAAATVPAAKHKHRRKPHVTGGDGVTRVGLALLAVYLIWGSTYLANRVALQSFPPVLMSAFRFLIAGGVFFVWLRARGVPAPSSREWTGAAIVGALLPAAAAVEPRSPNSG